MTSTCDFIKYFSIDNFDIFKKKAFAWAANAFDICCCLDNNTYTEGIVPPDFEILLALGNQDEIKSINENLAFEQLKGFYETKKDWLFGFLSYDLKNGIENLNSENIDRLNFPELHFFQPQILIKISKSKVEVLKNVHPYFSNDDLFENIKTFTVKNSSNDKSVELRARFSKEEYLETVHKILNHIQRGDIFEMNFCQEFYAENVEIDPLDLFLKLNDISKAPFSAFYKLKNKYLLCSSPERFLKKVDQKLISQPIKGTSKRGNTEGVDKILKLDLFNDTKTRSENVMIVDLVRNDLGKSCIAGTVKVSELFGIYTFPNVHQMISTIEGELKSDTHFIDALKYAFPMGSMTGAPKVRAMQLIEKYEKTKRGIYSGAIGYITPNGNFDFNVLIRSILYNKDNNYLSFHVGGAIIADSDPEKEFEECQIKSKGILKALQSI